MSFGFVIKNEDGYYIDNIAADRKGVGATVCSDQSDAHRWATRNAAETALHVLLMTAEGVFTIVRLNRGVSW